MSKKIINDEDYNDVYEEDLDEIGIDEIYGGFGKNSRYKSLENEFAENPDFYDQFYDDENWEDFDFRIPLVFKAAAILTSAVCIASVTYVSYSIIKYLKHKH